jgi:hypothetical protein
MNVEGIEEHLREFKSETYGKYDVVTVGEANGVGADQAVEWVDEKHGLFNMIFQFESTNLWEKTLGTLDGMTTEIKEEKKTGNRNFAVRTLAVGVRGVSEVKQYPSGSG